MTLGLCTGVLYLTNLRWSGGWDSLPARYLPFSILREGNFDLDEFDWLYAAERPYFLRPTPDGRWASTFPVATPLVVTPLYVPAVRWLAARGIDDGDARFRLVAMMMERLGAAVTTAVSVSLVLLALCTLTSLHTAAAIALVYGVGTSTWAISSQALWQHGLAELALAGLSLSLLRPDTRGAAVAAGGWAALGVLTRPSMVVFAALAAVFIGVHRRRRLPPFLLLPIAGGALLCAYNLALHGRLGGGYTDQAVYLSQLGPPTLTGVAGLLVSPNRGLFVFTPVALLALGALSRRGRGGSWPHYLLAGTAAYVLFYGGFTYWWAAQVYGPRYLVDTLPAFALCSVPAVEWLWRRRAGRGALLLLAGWSIAVQGAGVYGYTRDWDYIPNNINVHPERLWDWHDMQIVRAIRAGWHGTDLAPAFRQALTDTRAAPLRALAPEQLSAEIAPEQEVPSTWRAGETVRLRVRIRNRSDAVWPFFADWGINRPPAADWGFLQVALWYEWRAAPAPEQPWHSSPFPALSSNAPLPTSLGPGEVAVADLPVRAPRQPGRYTLSVRLAQLVRRASMRAGPPAFSVPVRVE